MLLPNPLFSIMAVCSLEVVAYYSDCSSIHSFDCSNYSASVGSGFDFDRCYPHIDSVVGAD